MAVQCFYMISGFLISLVLSHKYDPSTAEGRRLFYSNRALRIFVPYWSFCVMILGVHVLIYCALGIRFGVDAAFAQHWPEMTLPTRIYLLFSNIFILTQEWSMWLVYQSGAIIPVWNSDLHSPHVGTFQVIRVLSHRVYAYMNSRGVMRLPISLAIGATLIGTVLVQQYIDSLDNHKFYILVVAALPALFELSRRFRWDSWLGELSYPIYLAHLSVLSFGQIVTTAVIGPIEDHNLLALGMAVATVLICIAYVHWIDAPFERWRQARATRSDQERAPALLPQPQGVAVTA